MLRWVCIRLSAIAVYLLYSCHTGSAAVRDRSIVPIFLVVWSFLYIFTLQAGTPTPQRSLSTLLPRVHATHALVCTAPRLRSACSASAGRLSSISALPTRASAVLDYSIRYTGFAAAVSLRIISLMWYDTCVVLVFLARFWRKTRGASRTVTG